MKEIEHLTVFSGKDAFPQKIDDYDKVVDNSVEYESALHLKIDFYKSGKVVRTLWNPSCDIRYKEAQQVIQPDNAQQVIAG